MKLMEGSEVIARGAIAKEAIIVYGLTKLFCFHFVNYKLISSTRPIKSFGLIKRKL